MSKRASIINPTKAKGAVRLGLLFVVAWAIAHASGQGQTGSDFSNPQAVDDGLVAMCEPMIFSQRFDRVVAPTLPAGWMATNGGGPPPLQLWITSTTTPDTSPNDAFASEPNIVSDKYLDSPDIVINSASAQLRFRNFYDLETGFDGGVLEISSPNINGGAFTDVTDPAVGGSFVRGGYNATIDGSTGNPIGGRMAWTGSSGGYIDTVVNLRPNANGQTIKLRFRMGSDNSVSGSGWRIDTIAISNPAPKPPSDFNQDCNSDFVLFNGGSHRTAIWFLNNNSFAGSVLGPVLPSGWNVIDAADFDGDGNVDYVLFNASTRRTAIWYFAGTTFARSALGPTLPSGWVLVTTGDFNGDNQPDFVLYNATTQRTAAWFLNNNVFAGSALGPALPSGWILAGLGDFNGDGDADYALFNAGTRRTAIWYLSGTTLMSSVLGPALPVGWELAGVADFDLNGAPDYLLFNATTQRTAVWYLNNNSFLSSALGPMLPPGWSVVAP